MGSFIKDLIKKTHRGFTQHLVPRLSRQHRDIVSSKEKDSTLSAGFTIIEVMIVLAIAGLIMVIVFIAVPQLQRAQRDNARQSIANRLKAEMETYAGNNQGQYPFMSSCATTGCINDFYSRYIKDKVVIKDPSTGNDVMTLNPSTSTGLPMAMGSTATTTIASVKKGEFYIVYGAKCSGENVTASGVASTSSRTYAVVIGLDRDGTGYCVDNG